MVDELQNPVYERVLSPIIVRRGCSVSLFVQLWSKQAFTVNEALGHRLGIDRPTHRSSSISPLMVNGLFLKPIMFLLLRGTVREALTCRDGVLRGFSAIYISIKMPPGTVIMAGSDVTFDTRSSSAGGGRGPGHEIFGCHGRQ